MILSRSIQPIPPAWRAPTAGFVALLVVVAVSLAPAPTAWVIIPLLAAISVVSWRPWRENASPWGGAPVLIYFAGCAAYLIGSVRLADQAPYSDEITDLQWKLYAWTAIAAALAMAVGVLVRSRWQKTQRVSTQAGTIPAWAILTAAGVGLTVTWINFLTGRIPLFEESINEARKAGSDALLGKFSFLSYPTLEFVIIAAAALPIRRFPLWGRVALISVCVVSLVLTGSRSFLAFPIIALAFIFIEWKRPRLLTIAAIGAVLVFVVASAGQLRAFASGTGDNTISNAQKWGYGPPFTSSVLSNLQVGPHVFSAVQEVIPKDVPFQMGTFFLRDFPLIGAGMEADYWVTETLGRDSLITGGLPPTLLGGFYVDWGPTGSVMGTAIVFLLLAMLRPKPRPLLRAPPRVVAYGILCAYVVTSFYSYISLNVGIVTMFLWCVAMTIARRLDSVVVLNSRRRGASHVET